MADKKAREVIAGFFEDSGYNNPRGYGCPSHYFGLPHHEARVTPEYSDVDGARIICVSTTRVYDCTLEIPYNYNKWMVERSREYRSKDELLDILEEFVKVPKGIWSD